MSYKYNFDLYIGEKVIPCRAFTLREYKQILESKYNGTLKEKILEVINNCCDCSGLNKQEMELLIVKLWANSMGEVNIEADWPCDCGKPVRVSLNMNHTQITDHEDIYYDFGQFKIKFKYPEIFCNENKAVVISSCIDYIIVGNENLKIDDLTSNEIDDLYNNITLEDVEKIYSALMGPTIYLATPINCECGKTHIHTIKGLKEFFKLL